MAQITGFTAERMQGIEDGSIVDGDVIAGHLILYKRDGTQIDAGSVIGPTGATGATGPAPTIPVGTSLPASPSNGDEAVLVDSLTNPTYAWRFKYVSGIIDANKWVFVGGAENYIYDGASWTDTIPNTWTYAPDPFAPQFVVPRSGVWEFYTQALFGGPSSNQQCYLGVANVSLSTTPIYPNGGLIVDNYDMLSTKVRFQVTSGQTVRQVVNCPVTGFGISQRLLTALPVRIA